MSGGFGSRLKCDITTVKSSAPCCSDDELHVKTSYEPADGWSLWQGSCLGRGEGRCDSKDLEYSR